MRERERALCRLCGGSVDKLETFCHGCRAAIRESAMRAEADHKALERFETIAKQMLGAIDGIACSTEVAIEGMQNLMRALEVEHQARKEVSLKGCKLV